jgi:lipopolysaccharide export system permease protein
VNGPLARYLRNTLATQTLGVLVALTALLQVLELLDVTTDILKRKLGVGGILHYAMLRLPAELSLAMPLAMLIGSLFTFYTLARNHELVAIRAAGIRLGWVVRAMLPVAVVMALLQFVVSDRVMPRAEAALALWWHASDDGLVSIQHASRDGRHLQGVIAYRRGDDGQYAGRLSAKSADWSEGGWQLSEVAVFSLGQGSLSRSQEDHRAWATNLRPDDLTRAQDPQLPLSSTALIGVLAGERVGDRPASYYRTVLYRSYIAPLALAVMLLLALPATRAVQRGGQGGGQLLLALGCGLGFQLSCGLMASLGQAGTLSAALATGLPPLVFGLLGLVFLRRCDYS